MIIWFGWQVVMIGFCGDQPWCSIISWRKLYNIRTFLTSSYTRRSLLAFLYPDCSLLWCYHCDNLESYVGNYCVEAIVRNGDCCLLGYDTVSAGRRASKFHRVLMPTWSGQLNLSWSSEILGHLYQTTWYHILGGNSLCSQWCVKLRSQVFKMSDWNTQN